MSDEQDSWFQSAFGLNIGGVADRIRTEAEEAAGKVQSVVQRVQGAVEGVLDDMVETVTDVAKKVAESGGLSGGGLRAGGAASGPMAADCKPVKGYVPGPAEHLLCQTHGHILNVNTGQIIAASLAEYKRLGVALANQSVGGPFRQPGQPSPDPDPFFPEIQPPNGWPPGEPWPPTGPPPEGWPAGEKWPPNKIWPGNKPWPVPIKPPVSPPPSSEDVDLEELKKILIVLGISVALLGTIALALADPEPVSKLLLIGLTVVEIGLLFKALGRDDPTGTVA